MKILVTGSSGRVGRAIHARLRREHDVVGLDRVPATSTQVVATLDDEAAVREALRRADAVVHVAALHAPHVGYFPDAVFRKVNVDATVRLAHLAIEAGARRFIFTSTTALYGAGGSGSVADWLTEDTPPRPKTVYHRTKLAAEEALAAIAAAHPLAVTALRMSRCFPEPAPRMAAYRLHRGIDARDVADAHAAALAADVQGFRRYVISATTPFVPQDAADLAQHAPEVLASRAPGLVEAFMALGWPLPARIDRVYDSARAQRELGWRPRFGFEEVLRELERRSPEVLPP